MPIPLIAVAAIGIAALVVAAGGVAVLSDVLKDKKRVVALVGRPASGKSTFVHFLEHGNVPQSPLASTTQQQQRNVQIGESTVEVLDSGGDAPRIRDWKQAVEKSDVVLYFFDASLVAAEERAALSDLEADVGHLSRWRDDAGVGKTFVLVGTHSDLCTKDQLRRVEGHKLVTRLKDATGTRDRDVIRGSLDSDENAKTLSEAVAKRVKDGE